MHQAAGLAALKGSIADCEMAHRYAAHLLKAELRKVVCLARCAGGRAGRLRERVAITDERAIGDDR